MNNVITLHNVDYTLIKDYKEHEKYRQGLNRLTRNTYGFDFESWYQGGYWKERYIPYSLLHQDEVIANVSVNRLDFLVEGNLKHFLQIGTVMTDEKYRGRGLSRALIEVILKEYEEQQELIYLYANDSVLDFYPKFGFVKAVEYVHSRELQKTGKQYSYRKLDMNSATDRDLLFRLVTEALPVSKIAMVDNPGLPMFYLTKFMRDNIYYFEELKLVAVAEYEDGNMLFHDAFCREEFPLEEIINSLMDREKMRVTLGFTPLNTSGYVCEQLMEEGSTFFIMDKSATGISPIGEGRFPILSHA